MRWVTTKTIDPVWAARNRQQETRLKATSIRCYCQPGRGIDQQAIHIELFGDRSGGLIFIMVSLIRIAHVE
jgi:hypothetical protein